MMRLKFSMFITLLALIAVFNFLVTSPVSAEDEKIEGTLIVDTFGGAYAEAVKKYIAEPFEKKYNVKVKLNHFGSNSEQLAKLKAGKTDMDVTFLGNTYVYMAQRDKLLLPLRMENLPNYKDQFSMFQHPVYDPGPETYCVSFIWGDQAIAWNTEKADPPNSWGALWDPKYKGRVAMFGSGTSAIPVTAMYLGQDPNNITDLNAVKAKLLELRPNLLKFWKGGAELTQLLATEEVWVADFWRGRVNKLKEEGLPIEYTQPKEGSFVWIDCIAIPKDARNRKTAEAFIDFAISSKVLGNFVTKGVNYAPTSSAVKLTDKEKVKLGATDEIIKRAKLLDPAYITKMRDTWNQVLNEVMAAD
jgi:spermidine/putrescine transport system substrate-binding protein